MTPPDRDRRHPDHRLFTSESVTEGHPDKVADQISDTLVDLLLERDPEARVACETLVNTDLVLVAGEVSGQSLPSPAEIETAVRDTVRAIGYTGRDDDGFDADTAEVRIRIDRQSEDIASGVVTGGAGDQGMMFGYACDETEERMPLPIVLAHRITAALTAARRSGDIPYLGPDGKAQVTVAYDRDFRPRTVPTVVCSSQHAAEATRERIRRDLEERVIRPALGEFADEAVSILVNPTGKFVIGGPRADCGLTGRKIIVDTYGGMARHGGGAFSGKDPTKVDRSAAYMARYIAKNIVAAGLAPRVEVQLAYAIGRAEPVSVLVETGAGERDAALERAVREVFGLTPREIIEHLDLRRPRYRQTASGGHFGRDPGTFPWERTDRTEAIRRAAGR